MSNLSTVSKILERLVLTRLRPHLLESTNFSKYQSAYSVPSGIPEGTLDGTLRRASQQHPEVAACAEQCSQNRPPGTEAVSCQTADASTTLAAGSIQN